MSYFVAYVNGKIRQDLVSTTIPPILWCNRLAGPCSILPSFMWTVIRQLRSRYNKWYNTLSWSTYNLPSMALCLEPGGLATWRGTMELNPTMFGHLHDLGIFDLTWTRLQLNPTRVLPSWKVMVIITIKRNWKRLTIISWRRTQTSEQYDRDNPQKSKRGHDVVPHDDVTVQFNSLFSPIFNNKLNLCNSNRRQLQDNNHKTSVGRHCLR